MTKYKIIIIRELADKYTGDNCGSCSEAKPNWLALIAYLATLRATQPRPQTEAIVLRTLIIVVGIVLTVTALAAAGAPEVVAEVLQHWPLIP